jgi:nucleotide-binding universal stress UspA family protein
MNILIGYDGSGPSHAAVSDLRRAGLPAQATALVLTIAELPVMEPAVGFLAAPEFGYVLPASAEEVRRSVERESEHARAVAQQGVELVSELFPAWNVQTESPSGSAYGVIVDRAKAWNADLVVVGSHGRSAVGRFLFGSVAQNVLSHSPCSVRIGRGQDPDSEKPLGFPLRLLIGVDGSPGSTAAIEAASARGWPPGTEVRLATVADSRLMLALIAGGFTGSEAAAAARGGSPVERVTRAAGDRFRDSGLAVTTIVLEGDPKHMLLREAQRWGADCIFLGAQGHSRLERFLIGSVSACVAARGGCSVEVVRKPSQ